MFYLAKMLLKIIPNGMLILVRESSFANIVMVELVQTESVALCTNGCQFPKT